MDVNLYVDSNNGDFTLNADNYVETDPTLSQLGVPADAKATGDALALKVNKPSDNGVSGQVLATNGDGSTDWVDKASPADIADYVTDWLDDNVNPVGSAVVVDSSLTIAGAAADAKVTGDTFIDLKSDISEICEIYNTIDWSKASDNTALSSTNGSASSNTSYWVTDYIPTLSATYIITNYEIYKICYYDNSFAFVSATQAINDKQATLVNAKYVRVQFKKSIVAFNTSDMALVLSDVPVLTNPIKKVKKTGDFFLDIKIDDFDYPLKSKIIGLDSAMALTWESGTISGSSGQNAAGSSRFRCVGYLPIEAFYTYENALALKTRVFAYDKSFSYLGATGTGMSQTYYTKSDMLTAYPLCKYVRFVFQTDTLTDVTANTTIYGTETYYKSVKAYEIGAAIISPTGYEYSGERISINRNRLSYSIYDAFTGYGQDAVIYGDYAFMFKDDKALIRTLSTKTNIASPNLPVSAHCNSATWGNKYDVSDIFPLIYVNAYNAANVANGVCYVFRVTTNSSGVPNGLTLIQTITVGFTTVEPWTDGNDTRPYGNFFVDTINGFLWAYTLKDNINATRFFKFALPSTTNATVTITSADILEQFDVSYMPYIQGNTYNDGKIYILSGFGTATYHGMLNVVDLTSKAIVTQVDLYNIGLQIEPEFIDITNNKIVLGATTAYIFDF